MLKVDYIINKVIDKIFNQLNGEVSKETIKNIINFQSFTVRQGIEDGDDIHLKYIGSFRFNHKRAYRVEQDGIKGSMKTEQEIVKKENSKSWKVKEIRRIVFKKS